MTKCQTPGTRWVKAAQEIGLRIDHIGSLIPGQVLRLDLYRMACYFHSSEYLANLSDGGDYCPWQGLRDDFQAQEIIRILLQTAVAIRFIGFGHADAEYKQLKALESPVGRLFKKVSEALEEPLPLREACNMIIHAHSIILDSNGDGNPYRYFIKPRIFCYKDFEQKNEWKAEIDVEPFVELCNALAMQFS